MERSLEDKIAGPGATVDTPPDQFRFKEEVPYEATTYRDWVIYPDQVDNKKFIRIHEDDLKVLIDNINVLRFLAEINNLWKYGEQIVWRRRKGKHVAFYDTTKTDEVDLEDADAFYSDIASRITQKLFERISAVMRDPSNEKLEQRLYKSTKKLYERIMDLKPKWTIYKPLVKKIEKPIEKPELVATDAA